jgi:hypothetical protein
MDDIRITSGKFISLCEMFGFGRAIEILNALAREMIHAGGEKWTPEKRAEWFDRAFRERYGI